MEVCSNIFIACCWLHNFLLEDLMARTNVWVGHGAPIDDDSLVVRDNVGGTRTRGDA